MTDVPFIDIHTHSRNPGALDIVSYGIGSGKHFPRSNHVSAGMHPWDVESIDIDAGVRFLETARIAAIGEIGLDFASEVDKAKQIEVFMAQLNVAARRNLPVIIHCVKAYNETLQILQKFMLKAVVFHGYTGSPEQTETITQRGYYISIGERSLQSAKTVDSIRRTRLNSIFAETDTSKTAIEEIYNRLAVIKNVEVATLKQIIFSNFKTIFE